MKKLLFSLVIILSINPNSTAMKMKKFENLKKTNEINIEYKKNRLKKIIDKAALKIPDLYDIISNFDKENEKIFQNIFINFIKQIANDFFCPTNPIEFLKIYNKKNNKNNSNPISKCENLKHKKSSNFSIFGKNAVDLIHSKSELKNNWKKIEEFRKKFLKINDELKKNDLITKLTFILNEPDFDYTIQDDLTTDCLDIDVNFTKIDSLFTIFSEIGQILEMEKLTTKIILNFLEIIKFLNTTPIAQNNKNENIVFENLYFIIEKSSFTKEFLMLIQFMTNLKIIYEKIKVALLIQFGNKISQENKIPITDLTKNFDSFLPLFEKTSIEFFKQNPEIFKNKIQTIYFDPKNNLSKSFLGLTLLNKANKKSYC